MKKIQKSKRTFTLIELFICIAILAIASGAMAFPLKGMLDTHNRNQGAKKMMVQLKELQALALNYQSDMGFEFYKDEGKFYCVGFTDEPRLSFRPIELKNISSLTLDGKKAMMPLRFKVYASGRVAPESKVQLHFKGGQFMLDLSRPLLIKLKEKRDETVEPSI